MATEPNIADRAEQTGRPSDGDFRDVLASVDRVGRRRHVRARIFSGAWRRRRLSLAVLLIAFYLALPFLRVDGHPALRIDLGSASASVLGRLVGPQDLVFAVLAALIAIVALMLLTALAGRVFCAWLCPHSVFLEMVFRPIEARLTRGGRLRTPARLAAVWLIFALIAGAIANTVTALFVGVEGFRWGLFVDPVAHPGAALFFVGVFAFALFDMGWFREQACTIVCPYGRLQSVMIDAHTPVVAYDRARGEPRGKPSLGGGDCVDCGLCVAACPTGIDIRNGAQLECLHCAACVDACAGVMTKLGRSPDLIRFISENADAGRPRRVIRARTVLYAGALAALACALVLLAARRTGLEAVALRSDGLAIAGVDEGRAVVRQLVRISITNRTSAEVVPVFALPDLPEARLLAQREGVPLRPGERGERTLVVVTPVSALAHDRAVELSVTTASATARVPLVLRTP